MRTGLIGITLCLAASFSCSPALGAVAIADGGFEFSYKPALDGAGYMVQPSTNVRSPGTMAIEIGETLIVPVDPTPEEVEGRGLNNGDGTFTYNRNSGGGTSMGFVQGKGEGNGNPPIASPLVKQPTFTLEARFRVSGEVDDGVERHNYFWFESNALGSEHFVVAYGRQNFDEGTALWMSTPGPSNFYGHSGQWSETNQAYLHPPVDTVYDEWVTLRVVGEKVGETTTGSIRATLKSYVKFGDGEWLVGPSAPLPPSTSLVFDKTRDRGSLLGVLNEGGAEGADPTTVDVDYVRWKFAVLTTDDALAPVPEPTSLGLLGFGIAALLVARRRRS